MRQIKPIKKCPFCGQHFKVPDDVPADFVFEEIKSRNHRGYLCCNLCDAPTDVIEDLPEELE